jgi:hypothetical protein
LQGAVNQVPENMGAFIAFLGFSGLENVLAFLCKAGAMGLLGLPLRQAAGWLGLPGMRRGSFPAGFLMAHPASFTRFRSDPPFPAV